MRRALPFRSIYYARCPKGDSSSDAPDRGGCLLFTCDADVEREIRQFDTLPYIYVLLGSFSSPASDARGRAVQNLPSYRFVRSAELNDDRGRRAAAIRHCAVECIKLGSSNLEQLCVLHRIISDICFSDLVRAIYLLSS